MPKKTKSALVLPAPALPERYAAAIGGRAPLELLRKGPKRAKKLLKGATKKRLLREPEAGKWSAHAVVAHLCDAETMFGARLRFIVAMDKPPIAGWDENAFAARLPHASIATRDLLAAWRAARDMNVALLERLPAEAWSRTGLHSERGEESLSTLVHLAAAHDLVHEAQLERCLARRRAPRKRA